MKTLTRILTAAALFCAGSILLQAQTFTGLGVLDDIGMAGMTAGKKIVNVVFVISGLIAAIALVPAAIKAFKGEPQSRDAIVNVGIGSIAIFVILGIIKIVMNY